MGLNISKGNMYPWITHTWNTIKGECPHDCTYCYMKRWGKLNPVKLDEKELRTNLGSGNFIFVGSSCDMFAERIKHGWIADTLIHCSLYPNNKYMFQTKNPELIHSFVRLLPPYPKCVICTTIETNRTYPEMGNAPHPIERADHMHMISLSFITYVTIEPIMDFDLYTLASLVRQCNPKQVNIGADSGNNNLPEPGPEKIKELISELSKFTVVKQKDNLKRLMNSE